jgi:hypothetical protein
MKLVLVAALGFAVTGASWAEAPKASCIDVKSSYVARPLNSHDIFVQNSLGKPKPPVRLTTSCHRLEDAIGFGLSSEFTCIGRGDTVAANLMSDRQTCVVTKVAPYAPQAGDLPEKK